ncbi:MAG: acetylxylan esterase [Gemmataceae bacterium]|nr:acetylxylan esterase [Gemmataceae bacterium]
MHGFCLRILVLSWSTIALCPAVQLALGQSSSGATTTERQPPPPYPVDHSKPLAAKEEIDTEAEDFVRYRVEFTGIKDDRVPGYLYVPKHPAGTPRAPAILLQYGSGGNKKTNYIVEIGKLFAGRGYIVLTIDSPHQGERRGKDKKSANPLGLLATEQVMHYCGDYCRAVDYLESRRDVDRQRLGYVGISWGAITGIVYCAYDERIKAVGSMVGGGNFLGLWTEKDAAKALKEGSKSSDPVCHVGLIAPRPLLFINVTKDTLILRPWAESLHRFAGEGKKVVWLETDHYFRGLDRAEVCRSVIDFMDQSLKVERPQKQ